MADIQSATAKIRRGKEKKKERKKGEETTAQKYNVRICYAGGPLMPCCVILQISRPNTALE